MGMSAGWGVSAAAPDWRSAACVPLVPVLLFTLVLLALNPTGYLGGGGDDWHYLEAARCAAEHGFCLPPDHWSRRYPLVVPVGAAIALFGESRAAISIVPLAYGLLAIALIVTAVQRQYGRRAALLAGLALVATPVFSERLLKLDIGVTELAFVAAALFCLQSAHRGGGRPWILASGLMLGLAVQARPTALVMLPLFVGALWLMRAGWRWLAPFLAGCILPPAIEAGVYWRWVGDPLYPWKLALGHTTIPSTELPPTLDLGQSPLFNIAYIAGWKRPMGISVHWTVDGLLNLLVHPAIALTLACAAIFVIRGWRTLGMERAGGKPLVFLIAATALVFGALVYGLAIDPKPRMFLPIVVVASVCFGVLAARSWKEGRLLATACLALLIAKGAIASYDVVDLEPAAKAAPVWAAKAGHGLAVEERTARFLTLVPEVRRLPHYHGGAAQSLLLVGSDDCVQASREAHLDGWRVRRAQRFETAEPAAIAALRRHRLFFDPQATPVLCLLERA